MSYDRTLVFALCDFIHGRHKFLSKGNLFSLNFFSDLFFLVNRWYNIERVWHFCIDSFRERCASKVLRKKMMTNQRFFPRYSAYAQTRHPTRKCLFFFCFGVYTSPENIKQTSPHRFDRNLLLVSWVCVVKEYASVKFQSLWQLRHKSDVALNFFCWINKTFEYMETFFSCETRFEYYWS